MRNALLTVGLVAGIVGCGARGQVAKDKVLAQVDKLLGEIDVKKKEVELAIRNMDSSIDRLKKGKIESKVRLSQTSEKLSELEGRVSQAENTLRRLRDYLKSGKDVEINGRTFKTAELKDMADKTIAARKRLAVQADALKGSKKRLEEVVASLDLNQA